MRILFFLLILPLLAEAQSLKKTAKLFSKTMLSAEADYESFKSGLFPLLDPASDRDSLCADYYHHWKFNLENYGRPKIKKIRVTEKSADKATVRISDVWHLKNGEQFYYLSEIYWIKSGSRWYCSAQPAKIIDSQQLKCTR